jgi:starch phosphorylase
MKAAMNGLLNVSILDGWWPEGCEHGVNGWAIGDDTAGDDERDLESLYHALENDVLPAWSDRARWIRMMRASIAMATSKFSSDRMVRQYFDTMYADTPVEPAPPARPDAAVPAPEATQPELR